MVFWGILSIFQLVFIPGFMLTKLLGVRGLGKKVLFTFGFSILFNFQAVFILTVLHLYKRSVVLGLFAIEVLLFLYLTRNLYTKSLKQLTQDYSFQKFFNQYLAIPQGMSKAVQKIYVILGLLFLFVGVLGTLYIVFYYGSQFEQVFTVWDPVVSWDRWAKDWSANILPHLTWNYPQLIPVAWSLTYKFIGTTGVKFFAHWFMEFFEIFVPIALLIIGFIKKQWGYFGGTVIASWLLWNLGSHGSGYVDTPVACIGLVSLGILLIAENEQDERQKKRLIIGGYILACTAALVKQAGFWIILSYWVLFLGGGGLKNSSRKEKIIWISSFLLCTALMVGPWYIYKIIQINMKQDSSEISTISYLAEAKGSYWNRLVISYQLISSQIHVSFVSFPVIAITLVTLMVFSCYRKLYSLLVLFVTLPYIVAWALFFSYDIRNLTLVLPFIGLTAGLGLERVILLILVSQKTIRITSTIYQVVSSTRLYVVLLFVFLLISFCFYQFTDAYLIQSSVDKQKTIGDSELDAQLYKYNDAQGFKGFVLTDYQMMFGLPNINQYYRLGYSSTPNYIPQLNQNDVYYGLYCSSRINKNNQDYINEQIKAGKFTLLFREGCWSLIETCHGECR